MVVVQLATSALYQRGLAATAFISAKYTSSRVLAAAVLTRSGYGYTSWLRMPARTPIRSRSSPATYISSYSRKKPLIAEYCWVLLRRVSTDMARWCPSENDQLMMVCAYSGELQCEKKMSSPSSL